MFDLIRAPRAESGGMTTMKIKLMADYHCWPLWYVDTERVGNLDLMTLPLSHDLQRRLEAWAECYDKHLNPDDPAHPPCLRSNPLGSGRKSWHFWRDLQKELGPTYEVVYYAGP